MTIRIPEDKRKLFTAIASLENRKIKDLRVDLIDECAELPRETLELLAILGLYDQVRASAGLMRPTSLGLLQLWF